MRPHHSIPPRLKFMQSTRCILIFLCITIYCRSDSIQTVNYDGEDFHLVLSNSNKLLHPFAISVFENWVYWSDWRGNSINRVSYPPSVTCYCLRYYIGVSQRILTMFGGVMGLRYEHYITTLLTIFFGSCATLLSTLTEWHNSLKHRVLWLHPHWLKKLCYLGVVLNSEIWCL